MSFSAPGVVFRSFVSALGVIMVLAHGADAFRCGTELVEQGDSRITVLDKCGPPDDKTYSIEERELGTVTRTVVIETWIYNPGPTDFIRFLTFEDGRLRELETGGYGYQP